MLMSNEQQTWLSVHWLRAPGLRKDRGIWSFQASWKLTSSLRVTVKSRPALSSPLPWGWPTKLQVTQHIWAEWCLIAFSFSWCQSGAVQSCPSTPLLQQELLLCYWNCCVHFLGTSDSSNRNTQWEVWTNSTSVCSSRAARGGEWVRCASCPWRDTGGWPGSRLSHSHDIFVLLWRECLEGTLSPGTQSINQDQKAIIVTSSLMRPGQPWTKLWSGWACLTGLSPSSPVAYPFQVSSSSTLTTPMPWATSFSSLAPSYSGQSASSKPASPPSKTPQASPSPGL